MLRRLDDDAPRACAKGEEEKFTQKKSTKRCGEKGRGCGLRFIVNYTRKGKGQWQFRGQKTASCMQERAVLAGKGVKKRKACIALALKTQIIMRLIARAWVARVTKILSPAK